MNNVTIIVGSHRLDSESLKIGQMMAQKLEAHEKCDTVSVINLAEFALPFWQERYSAEEQAAIDKTRVVLMQSDAFIFVVPEWNGMVPSAMKNLFLLFSTREFGHKPALLVSVSAGIGGTYPILEMRSTTFKNCRICYIPEHLIFRDVANIFNGQEGDDLAAQAYMSARTDFALQYLMLYSDSLKQVRSSAPEYGDFANGM